MSSPVLRHIWRGAASLLAIGGVVAMNIWATGLGAQARSILPIRERSQHPLVSFSLPPTTGAGPFVSELVYPTLSPAVRDLPPAPDDTPAFYQSSPRERPSVVNSEANITDVPDPLAGRVIAATNSPSPLFTVEGTGNSCACSPPDTVGDVGPNHYVQMVNASKFSIYSKTGTVISANVSLNSLWTSGTCSTSTRGDPVVVYDALADRWVLAQFYGTGNGICVAVSQTRDPTGRYFVYAFTFPSFPDYFKISVWPDAYYVSANESNYSAAALDRAKMLAGQPTTMVRFAPGIGNLLIPANVNGPTPPPANAPGYFYTFKDDAYHGGGADRLEIYEFRPNWTTPASSTFTLTTSIPISSFTYTVCGYFVFSCIPQNTNKVDAVSEWPMYRMPYRNFGDHETLVGNFTVDVGGDRAGIRWFELRKSGTGNWTLYQEGTHAPADTLHRWMGSIAMDKNGNIALGYSRANTSTFASIFVATRAPTDTLGALQTETVFYTATGSQTSSNRWGDYSAMSVDSTDDCTFWFTTEYYPTSAGNTWHTRLGSFRMPDCTSSPYGLSLSPATAGQAANPGQVVTYTLAVTNTGSASDTFTVTLSGNVFSTNLPATVGPLAAGTSANFNVVVTLPGGAAGGANDVANINVQSQGDPTKQANAVLTTNVNTLRGLSLSPLTSGQAGNPGQVVTYTLAVTNTGNASDTFTVTLSGNSFSTAAPATVGPLAAGASANLNVVVTIPGGAAGGATDAVNVNVKSRGDPTKQANATLTTTVNTVRGVSLSPITATLSAGLGQVVTYTLTLTNTGNATDSFSIGVTGNTFTTSAPVSVGPLAAGASTMLNVVVTLPTGAAAQSDMATVTATSQGNGSVTTSTILTTVVTGLRLYLPFVIK